MCDSDTNSSAQAIVALRMKSSSVNPFFANPLPNETNSQITSTSVNNITAVNNAFTFGQPANHRMPSQSSSNFNVADYHRLQFYDYASQASVRFRLSHSAFSTANGSYGLNPAYGHPAFADGTPFAAISPFARFDSRFRFIHEEPKPQHSYIGLIAMAILSSTDQKMVLSDIYQHILDNYPYFRNRGPGWRNSIRHNLSLNDCFVKAGRSANGKGHYWAIHPANLDDFKKGDFRRRKAQRKVRKHMGLSVPEDEDSPSPTPPPLPQSQTNLVNSSMFGHSALIGPSGLRIHANQPICANDMNLFNDLRFTLPTNKLVVNQDMKTLSHRPEEESVLPSVSRSNIRAIKRQFDVESLLAPDCDSTVDDSISRMDLINKKCLDSIEQLDENRRSNTPSIGSQTDFMSNKVESIDSNSSSPSISSTAEKHRSSPMSSMPCLGPSALSLSPTSWRAAHLQSLQNLHQMNAGLMNQSLPPGFPTNLPWAVSAAALSNAQMAATILGYASVTNQALDFGLDANKR